MTAKTITALTRATTINAEKAKVDKDAYVRARDDIATLERGFETFLFERQMNPQNEASKAAGDIDQMMNSNSFGSNAAVKYAINDFYAFVGQAISSLQHYPDQWKNADDFRQQARQKQQKALDALDHWLFE
jgi:DNA replication initiation complex subunit (GINS family)